MPTVNDTRIAGTNEGAEAGNTMLHRRQSGFTLLELVITMIVLAILAMIAVPSFRTLIEKSRLRGKTDDVLNLLSVARGEAIKRHLNVNVALNGSTTAWCIGANRAVTPTVGNPTPGAAACDCTSPTSCVLEDQVSVITPDPNSGITSDTFAGNITFDAQTGALIPITTVPGVITFSSPSGFQLQVTVSALGQVAACTPAGKSFISGFPSC